MSPLHRRQLLAAGGAVTAGALSGAFPFSGRGYAADRSAAVFAHGVASGDPLPDAVLLWTRVTPGRTATPGSGRGPDVTVAWEISEDATFTPARAVRRGSVRTGPGRDHTVKLDVAGLQPGRTYYYRFSCRGEHSPVGRTRTAPAPAASPDRLRFGVVSCANAQAGWFGAYRHLARQTGLDAVIHLGDYYYEYGPGEYGYGRGDTDVRPHDPPHEAVTLADYRRRHAQYKADPDTAALHAAAPMIATWDDHEVANDAWAGGAENHDPDVEGAYAARRRAAHRAYDEWMPVRLSGTATLRDGDRVYRRLRFGTLAELSMLDLRSYRSRQVGAALGRADDPDRMLTGEVQMNWLRRGLDAGVQWKLVGNPVMIAPVLIPPLPRRTRRALQDTIGLLPSDGVPYNADQWDGYTAGRHALLDHLADAGITDTVFLTGDIHSSWAADLPRDPGLYPVSAQSLATELVCSSVTSNNLDDLLGAPRRTASLSIEAAIQTANRHIRYLNFDDHGFSMLEVSPARTQMDWYAISDRADPDATAWHQASWAVAAGSQRVHPVRRPAEVLR